MKSIRTAAGIVLGLAVLAGLLVWSMAGRASSVAEESAKGFIDRRVPEILQGWSVDRLLELSADEMKRRASRQEFDKMMLAAKERFGDFQKYLGCTKPRVAAEGQMTVASSTASASCDKGTVYIDLRLVSSGKDWQFARFFLTDKPQ